MNKDLEKLQKEINNDFILKKLPKNIDHKKISEYMEKEGVKPIDEKTLKKYLKEGEEIIASKKQ